MVIRTEDWMDWHIVAVEDEFVVKNLIEVRKVLEAYEGEQSPKIVFDLTQTSYIDSSAITLMLNYQKRLLEQNGIVNIFGANEDTLAIFSIVGLDKSIRVHTTREEWEQSVG